MLKRKRILIVEDDERCCNLFTSIIHKNGGAAFPLRDPGVAVSLLERENPDCVLLDNHMPLMKGVDLFDRHIRTKHIPTVMISGDTDIADTVHFLKSGGIDFLKKPAGTRDIIWSIYNALNTSYVPHISERQAPALQIGTSWDIYNIVRGMSQSDKEIVAMLYLDINNGVTAVETVAIGSPKDVYITCRDIFKRALWKDAAAIVLAHNHPSGNLTPSEDDRQMTWHLKTAGEYLNIPLLQHLIVTKKGFTELI